jgi:hypothetical protein
MRDEAFNGGAGMTIDPTQIDLADDAATRCSSM